MDDAQKRKFGEGQLLLAMMANFVYATGERNPNYYQSSNGVLTLQVYVA